MPESVRSRIISLSNSATLARIWSNRRLVGFLFVGVERLAGSDEPDAVAGECGQLLIQVEHGAAKPINLPDGNAVELPLGGIGHQAVKGRTLALAPENPVSTYSPAFFQSRRAMYSRNSGVAFRNSDRWCSHGRTGRNA